MTSVVCPNILATTDFGVPLACKSELVVFRSLVIPPPFNFVDMSEPISIQVENQTDIDILTKLDLLDDEDTNKVLDFINNLLTIKKYEGIEDSPIEYVTK